jgi:hypothetical protein
MKKRYYCDSHVEKEENNNENSESDTAMFSSAELFCRKIRRATYPYSPKQGHFRALYILLQATCLIQKHPCSHIAVKPMSQPRKRGCTGPGYEVAVYSMLTISCRKNFELLEITRERNRDVYTSKVYHYKSEPFLIVLHPEKFLFIYFNACQTNVL